MSFWKYRTGQLPLNNNYNLLVVNICVCLKPNHPHICCVGVLTIVIFELNSRSTREICITFYFKRQLHRKEQSIIGRVPVWVSLVEALYSLAVIAISPFTRSRRDVVELGYLPFWHDGINICIAYRHTIKFFSIFWWFSWWWLPGFMASNSPNRCF